MKTSERTQNTSFQAAATILHTLFCIHNFIIFADKENRLFCLYKLKFQSANIIISSVSYAFFTFSICDRFSLNFLHKMNFGIIRKNCRRDPQFEFEALSIFRLKNAPLPKGLTTKIGIKRRGTNKKAWEWVNRVGLC